MLFWPFLGVFFPKVKWTCPSPLDYALEFLLKWSQACSGDSVGPFFFRVNKSTPWNRGMAQEFNLNRRTQSLHVFIWGPDKEQYGERGEGRPGAGAPSTLAVGSESGLAFSIVISTPLPTVPIPLQSRDLSVNLSHYCISCILPGCKRAIAQLRGGSVGSCSQTSLRDCHPNYHGTIFTLTSGMPSAASPWTSGLLCASLLIFTHFGLVI